MFDISDAIKSVGEAFESLANYLKTSKDRQSETQIIKDKNRLKKAVNIAEEAFRLIEKNQIYLPSKVYKEFEELRADFDAKD